MADKLMRAQVTIPLDAGLPEDYVTNTWYFDGDDIGGTPNPGDYHDTVMDLLTAFYQAIDGVIFPTQVNTPATVKIYDMRDPEERVPEFTGTIALVPNAADMLPSEVAIVNSFRAEYESGVNPQRRRGRIYLGPICTAAGEVAFGHSRPSGAARATIAAASETLQEGKLLDDAFVHRVRWAVYSPTTDLTSSIDDAFNDVIAGWVDDAWDTQRRRGAAATGRNTWAA